MYARLVSFTGAKDVDAGISYIRESVLPVIREQKGFKGMSVSADRAGGVLVALSLWETEADRDASESALAKARQQGVEIVGGTVTVETFEEAAAEVAKPPMPGSALMVRRIKMDPNKIDENTAFFKNEIVPQIKTAPGFMALRNFINRKTGEGVAGTVWMDESTREAASRTARERQSQGESRGVEFGEITYREIVISELP